MARKQVNSLLAKSSVFAIASVAAIIFINWTATGDDSDERDERPVVPAFAKTQPAKNPTTMSLIVDQQKILGWISGNKDFSGREVTVVAGDQSARVVVQADNTFTWNYDVEESVSVKFTLGELKRTEQVSPVKVAEPGVFFVVDRTVCRPSQLIQFAGFLRQLDEQGEFVPLIDREVEVRLTSCAKKTVAYKATLTSDDFGRVVGQYQFSDADSHDIYDLSLTGFKGTAEVKLGEFRKAKVKLKIDGNRDGEKMKLGFQAVDFLDKPVPGSRVRFTAQVVRGEEEDRKLPLKADDFVYHEPIALPFDVEHLGDEQRLLWEAGIATFPTIAANLNAVVAQREGDVTVGDTGRGEHTLALQKEWTNGGYSIIVSGVLTDYNGREQRALRKMALGKAFEQQEDDRLRLSLTPRQFGTGDAIHVGVQTTDKGGKRVSSHATVVAMKLTPEVQNNTFYPYWGYRGLYNQRGHVWNHHQDWQWRLRQRIWDPQIQGNGQVLNWNFFHQQNTQVAKRTMVTAAVAKRGVATLTLDEPGAYKLVCVAELPGGEKLTDEVGCVVRATYDMPGLVLNLDEDLYQSGDTLTGELHSRFRNARVLLTITDSTGVRLWKSMKLSGSAMRIREQLPLGLRYGANVQVQYIDAEGKTHVDSQFVRVEPTERMLTVEAATKDVYQPGEEVEIDLTVNRSEPVDLVVSVYDQSLLGVAADRSKDIRSFYLADERVRTSAAHDTLRRKLGDVTVRALIERGEAMLKDDTQLESTQEGSMLKQAISYYRNSRHVNSQGVQVLLSLAGVDAVFDPAYLWHYGHNWHWQAEQAKEDAAPAQLNDVLAHEQSQWQLRYHFVGTTLALRESHPSHAQHQHLFIPQYGIYDYAGCGRLSARGDAHFSVAANASHSKISGQAFISHMPAVPAVMLESNDPGVSVRRDFSDSAFFNARIRTDELGKATVKFKLPDSLTNWRVVVTAVSKQMHVGQLKASFRTFKPIMVWPMIPRIFTEGDEVNLYASVHNRTDQPQEIDVSLKVENGEILSPREVHVRVPAKDNVPVYWTFQPNKPGYTQLLMTARSKAGSDASLKRLPVTPLIAEQSVGRSGFCKGSHVVEVPEGVNLENSALTVTLVPSLADDLVQSLDYLVQYPHGCVEQTMSRFLPAIRVAQTLNLARIDNPELQEKLPGVVNAGVKRLLQLQKPDGGWGWQGSGNTHEMMTPYALYGLLGAEKAGYAIPNEQAVQQGLNRLAGFISSMGEAQAADRIYCIYVYSHRHELLDEWWTFIEQQAENDNLSDYALALSLEMAAKGGEQRELLANKLVAALTERAQRTSDTASWNTANFSRWGNDRFEITAAVLKALSAHDPEHELIAPTLVFFATTKEGNRWNTTKATAMTIYAICDYLATQNQVAGAQHNLKVQVNDGPKQTVALKQGESPKIRIAGKDLEHGKNRIRFEGQVPGAMYRAVFRYWKASRDIKPLAEGIIVTRRFYLLNDEGGTVREIKSGDSVPRGAYIRSEVIARNVAQQPMSYLLIENPKPSNCEILPSTDTRFNQNSTAYVLREDKTIGTFFHHEQTPWQVTDYTVLHAELAGTFAVPPARAELMYDAHRKGHSGTFSFHVEDDASE